MTREEFKENKKQLDFDHYKATRNLEREYALSNNPYKSGDIVRDHSSILKIEGIHSVYLGLNELPCLVYKGIELTKQLKPTKRQQQTTMYQSNIIEKLSL